MMRIYLPLVLVFLLFTSLGTARADIHAKLSELEGLINQLDIDQDAKNRFGDYIDMIRDNLDFAHFSTTGNMVDAILVQLASMILEGDLPLSGSAPAQDSEDGPMDILVRKVDEIKAEELFFKANKADLSFLPSETYYVGSMGCSVQIFARGLGPVMFDPGGVLYLRFGDTAELMAVAFEGGTFTWDWDQGNDNEFYSNGDRAYFRTGEYETASVRVTFRTEFGSQCEAVLRVIMQDGFPLFGGD
jgi:hypothetical protein